MADITHKAHRPAQAGAKAEKKKKDNQNGANEKVFNILSMFHALISPRNFSCRLLHPSRVGALIGKVVAMPNVTRLDYMYRL